MTKILLADTIAHILRIHDSGTMVSGWSCTLYKVVWKKTVLIIALSMCIHFNSLRLKNGGCLYRCFWFVYFYSYWIILEVQRQYYPLPSGNKRNKGYRSNQSQLSQRIQRIHSAKRRRHNKLNANLMGCQKKKGKKIENIWQYILWITNNI